MCGLKSLHAYIVNLQITKDNQARGRTRIPAKIEHPEPSILHKRHKRHWSRSTPVKSGVLAERKVRIEPHTTQCGLRNYHGFKIVNWVMMFTLEFADTFVDAFLNETMSFYRHWIHLHDILPVDTTLRYECSDKLKNHDTIVIEPKQDPSLNCRH